MDTEVVNAALQTGRGISEFGMMAITAGFFLVLSALMWIACFRWFMSIINGILSAQGANWQELKRQMIENNHIITRIAEGLQPETQLRVKTLSNLLFDLSVEKVCRIIKKIREENQIVDKENTIKKIRTLLTNIHEDRNSKLDCFTYHGNKLSDYTDRKWIDQVAKVVEAEIYNVEGPNNGRAYTNIESVYANIRLEFYHNLNER